jgi:hypothetical protein
MVSVAPVPEVTTLPLTSSTEALKAVSTVLGVVTEVGGAVVKATWVAAPGSTVIAVLVAVAMILVESVATRVQVAPVLIVTAVKVASPATAVAVVVPVRVHVDVSEMTSVALTPVVRGIPLLSSTDTAKDGRTIPDEAVVGGSGVKPSSAAVFVATAIAVLVAAVNPVSPDCVSVAVNTQFAALATVMLIAVNVVTPLEAAMLPSVPATEHPADADVTESVSLREVSTLPYWSSIDTFAEKFAPLVTAVIGSGVNINFEGAAAVTVKTWLPVEGLSGPAEVFAVRVHEVPTWMTRPLNVATSPPGVWVVMPAVMGHDDVTLTVSPAEAAVTVNPKAVPAMMENEDPPNVNTPAAEAGDAATNARPASIRADVAPTATRDFVTDPRDRRPSLRFTNFLIRISAFALPVRFEYLNMCFMGTT